MNSSEPSSSPNLSSAGPSSTQPSSPGPLNSNPSSALEFMLEQPNTALVYLGRALALLALFSIVLAVLSFNLVFFIVAVVSALVVWRLLRPLIVLYLSGPDDIIEQTRYYPTLSLGRGRGTTLGVRRLGFLRGVDIVAVQDKRGSGYRTTLRFEQEETLELRMKGVDLASQVVGGVQAGVGEAPWIVGLYYAPDAKSFDQICGASLIAPGWVLTAAHCVTNEANGTLTPVANLGVLTGTQDLNSTSYVGALVSVRRYPGYSSQSYDGDLALLELKTPVASAPLLLTPADDTALTVPGRTVTVYGWGDTLAQPY